jgi:hypothetical protein
MEVQIFTPSSHTLNPFVALMYYLTRPKIDPLSMISENKSIMGFNLIWLWDHLHILRTYFDDLWKISSEPQHIGRVYDWNHMHKALNEFQSGKTIGKIVIRL